ncbi:hypothetical protein [Sutterella wadsworthensis]|uniref:hypothetical protein n=1 Tax=Sutterella wadsworthensis TaxID=40545 RepID=UPI003A8FE7C1
MSSSQAANALGHTTWSIFDESQVNRMIEKGAQFTKLKKKIKAALHAVEKTGL